MPHPGRSWLSMKRRASSSVATLTRGRVKKPEGSNHSDVNADQPPKQIPVSRRRRFGFAVVLDARDETFDLVVRQRGLKHLHPHGDPLTTDGFDSVFHPLRVGPGFDQLRGFLGALAKMVL